MVVEIPLSKTGKYAGKYVTIVDDCDADLAEFNWALDRKRYAARSVGYYKARDRILLHRLILERVLGRPLVKGEDVDHINNNGFDNRRENLRIATRSQNAGNHYKNKNNTSGYKGVYRRGKRWAATIRHNWKQYHLGYFDSPEAAHEAYCEAARRLHGDFANDGNSPLVKKD